MEGHRGSFEVLNSQVIARGLCVTCGGCVGHCPYLEYKDGRVIPMDRCDIAGGRCESICPQLDVLRGGAKDIGSDDGSLFVMAKSTSEEILAHSQYGGVVSTVVAYLLKEGLIERAILTDKGGEGSPKGVVANSLEQVISCAGSRYTGSATLSELNRLAKEGPLPRLAVVGLPCQMRSVSLMEEKGYLGKEGVFKIGLFCTWAMDYRKMAYTLRQEGIEGEIVRFDIPPPPANVFVAYGHGRKWEIPLDKMRAGIQRGCLYCPDMTANFADLSVGAAEGVEGYNTVCVRTNRAMDIWEELLKKGLMEVSKLPEENERHLREAIQNKKNRAVLRLKEGDFHGDME